MKHEDLCASPAEEFRSLFGRLSLRFTDSVAREISSSSDSGNPVNAPNGVTTSIRRNSSAVVHSWRRRLTAAEGDRVRSSLQDLWPAFYSEEDW